MTRTVQLQEAFKLEQAPANLGAASMMTYTTLGCGNVTLEGSWRLLSSLQAANGILMFGWSTAIIVAAVHRRDVFHADGSDA